MKKIFLAAATVILLSTACNTNEPDDSKDVAKEENNQKFDSTNIEDDTRFAVNIADAGLLEVQSSELALKAASSKAVKDFAKTIIDTHGATNEELKTVANRKNISLPTSLSEGKQKKYNDLSSKSGKDFDKEYVDCLIKEHKDAIDAFEKEAEKGNDADLREWAKGKLPIYKQHLELLESIKENRK